MAYAQLECISQPQRIAVIFEGQPHASLTCHCRRIVNEVRLSMNEAFPAVMPSHLITRRLSSQLQQFAISHGFTLTPAASMAEITASTSATITGCAKSPGSEPFGNSTTSAAREACHACHAASISASTYPSPSLCSGNRNRCAHASNSALIFSSIPTSLPAPAGHVVDSGAGDLQIERPLNLGGGEACLLQGDDHGPLQVAGLGIVVCLSVEPAIQAKGAAAAGN